MAKVCDASHETLVLRRDTERAAGFNVTIGHARSVKRSSGVSLAVQENQPACGVRAKHELANAGVGYSLRQGQWLVVFFAMRKQHALVTQQVGRHFGHHDLHDAFAVSRTGNTAGLCVRITAAANQRGIANAARKFAARSAGGCRRYEMATAIECDSADGS